jgi:hypothetical protein
MKEPFREESKLVQKQLSKLYTMRLAMETKQQVLLSKSIYLSRFIKIASLDHIRNAPEIDGARKLLSTILPNLRMRRSLENFRELASHSAKNSVN